MKRAYTDQHAEAGIDAPLPEIETWPNQFPGYEIEITIPEFTSVCPKTGLPDFGQLTLRYVPDKLCLELKSFKMYTLAYRNLGIFYENVVNRFLRDVVSAAKPVSASITGEFTPRGGLHSRITATYTRSAKGAAKMAADSNLPDSNAQRLAELAALVDAVKERVRAQYPESSANGAAGVICVGLPDLSPLARARDAAAGKMAAIGTVNPRPGGLVNNSIQSVKRAVSRALNWFVRDQVVFNRQVIACVEVSIEALADVNRTIHTLAGQVNTEIQQIRAEAESLRVEAGALRAKTSDLVDLASHWHRWREEWQLKLHRNEVEFLKSVADLNAAVQQKIMYIEAASQQRVAGVEQNMRVLHETAFQKTATELDASYRQTALQLEAACQQTAARVESSFAAAVVPMEAGFRETVSQIEANFEKRVSQLEHDTAASLQVQHDAFEQLANSNAENHPAFDRRADYLAGRRPRPHPHRIRAGHPRRTAHCPATPGHARARPHDLETHRESDAPALRLRPFRRSFPWLGRIRYRIAALLRALLCGTAARARCRLWSG